VLEETARSVKTPNKKGVPWPAIGESFLQGRTLCLCATRRLGNDLLAPGSSQGVVLQIKRLVPGRDSGTTEIHTLVVSKPVMECKYRNRDSETVYATWIKDELDGAAGAQDLSQKPSFVRRWSWLMH
jgi:hypothetical protein